MSQLAPIKFRYREFWDVPRIFLVPYQHKLFLFDCPFDEKIDDYPDFYKVYLLPELTDDELAGSWDKLHLRATQFVGEVPIEKIRFDWSKRSEINLAVLEELTVGIRTG